jgi:putative phage-type endonuclease
VTTARLLGHYEPGSPAWLAARRNRLGASEIAAVMGLSPWMSPFAMWHEKAGNIAPQFESKEMAWGKDVEDTIARWFSRTYAEFTMDTCGLYVNRDRDYQVAQPDRRLVHLDTLGMSLLEAKTDRRGEHWGKPGTDDIPVYYRCQAMWQLDCFELETCYVAASISGAPPEVWMVTWDAAEAQLLRDAAVKFLASLAAGEAPDIDGHIATYRAVKELHPLIDGSDVQIDVNLASEYLKTCEEYDYLETAKRAVSARIIDVMGNARYAKVGKEKIAMRVPNGAHPPYLKTCKTSRKASDE